MRFTKIKNLFSFIDYLYSNISRLNSLQNSITTVKDGRVEKLLLARDKNFKNDLRIREINEFINPLLNELKCSFDEIIMSEAERTLNCKYYSDNMFYSFDGVEIEIRLLIDSFLTDEIDEILESRRKYIEFRLSCKKYCDFFMSFFEELDLITKPLFEYFNTNHNVNEFDSFQRKTVIVKDSEELKEYIGTHRLLLSGEKLSFKFSAFNGLIGKASNRNHNQLQKSSNIVPSTIKDFKSDIDYFITFLTCYVSIINTMYCRSVENQNFELFDESLRKLNKFFAIKSLNEIYKEAELYLTSDEVVRFKKYCQKEIELIHSHLINCIDSNQRVLSIQEENQLENIFHLTLTGYSYFMPTRNDYDETTFSVQLVNGVKRYFNDISNLTRIDKEVSLKSKKINTNKYHFALAVADGLLWEYCTFDLDKGKIMCEYSNPEIAKMIFGSDEYSKYEKLIMHTRNGSTDNKNIFNDLNLLELVVNHFKKEEKPLDSFFEHKYNLLKASSN